MVPRGHVLLSHECPARHGGHAMQLEVVGVDQFDHHDVTGPVATADVPACPLVRSDTGKQVGRPFAQVVYVAMRYVVVVAVGIETVNFRQTLRIRHRGLPE